jgi:hypothetical protein
MKKNIKVFLYNENTNKLTAHHRPFYPTSEFEVDVTSDFKDSDFILVKPNNYDKIVSDKNFTNVLDKVVLYANDDNPNRLLKESKVKKLIAQPRHTEEELNKFNATTIPLLMTDHEVIHLDKEFIDKCRNQEKIYDYYFVGQIYGNRTKLKKLNLPNSIIKTSGSIYGLNPEQKLKNIKNFLMELGKAKFGFAPRGDGSNSFRLYECLMVGTVPIATDVITYPYEKDVDWNSFSVRGSLNNVNELINKTNNIDYKTFRENGINFWENHCKMDVLYNNILTKLNLEYV